MIKVLFFIAMFTGVAYGSSSEEIKHSLELIDKNGASWVNTLSRDDVKEFSSNSLYFDYFALLFSKACEPNVLQELLDKGMNPNVRGQYETLADILIMNCKENKSFNKLLDAGLDINITRGC